MSKVSVSVLSSSIKASDIVKVVDKSNADLIHIDIMDGKFVSNKTWSNKEVFKFLKDTSKKIEVHLMVKNPLKYLDDFAVLNTEYFIFHIEAVKDVKSTINKIKEYGLKVGISIKPETNVESVFTYLKDIDEVLVMSVNPGKSGQEFIENSINKISELKKEIDKNKYKTIISVDGGINDITGKECIESGCDMLVSASYIHKDIINNINTLKEL